MFDYHGKIERKLTRCEAVVLVVGSGLSGLAFYYGHAIISAALRAARFVISFGALVAG